MSAPVTNACGKEDGVICELIEIIEEVWPGWERRFDRPIGPDTFLGADLGLKSLDLVRLASAIQKRYGQNKIPFHKLFVSDDGQIREDIQLSYLADFLSAHAADR